MNTWLWGIGAGVIAFVELHAPGYYLIWIACGAATTAAANYAFDLALEGQLVAFAVASPAFCVVGYFVYRRLLYRSIPESSLNRRELQIIGTKGVVAEPLVNGHGKVRLGDSVWLAEGPDLAVGVPIVVRQLRGTTVIVEERS